METQSSALQKITSEAAREKFIRALRQAKRDGVDVDEVFAGERERVMMAKVRIFGVAFYMVWGMVAPPFIIVVKAMLIHFKLEHSWVPVDLTYWICGVSFLSVIAFAFNLVDINDYLPRFLGGTKHEEDE